MNKKLLSFVLIFPLLLVSFSFGKVSAEAPLPEVEVKKEPVVEKKDFTVDEIKSMVDYYADKHGLSRNILHKVISCESQYNENAVNWNDSHKLSKGSHGVGQFSKETFIGFAKQMGKSEYTDPYNPKQALDVASWAISKGYGYHWSCYSK